MFKRIGILLTLLLTLVLTSVVQAQPAAPEHSDPVWQASYWNNKTLTGAAALTRTDANIDFNWANGSPGTGVNADQFSARWTRYIDVTPGTYRFTAVSDDGMRVWIDSEQIINDWSDHAVHTVAVDKYLGAGHHLITVEYYENTGGAVAKFSWAAWHGEYFNNTTLSGTPTALREDPTVDFNWGTASPIPGTINSDNFSVRWTRTLNLTAGNYRFSVTVDDGVRLWVNNHLLVDKWQIQAVTTYTGDIYLAGGDVPVKIEYYDGTGQAVMRLSWTTISGGGGGSTPPPGTIIVDNTDTGFSKGGSSTSWRSATTGYNGSMLWTKNNKVEQANFNWAKWSPALTAGGRYEVFVYMPYWYTTTASASYVISYQGGVATRTVNQSLYNNEWVSLGTYTFNGNSNDYVYLSDITGETYVSRIIGFDAMKWEPR
jgi:hypothetical protein